MSLITALSSNKSGKTNLATFCVAKDKVNNRKCSYQRPITFRLYPELWTTSTVGGTVEAALAHASLNVFASIMFLAQKYVSWAPLSKMSVIVASWGTQTVKGISMMYHQAQKPATQMAAKMSSTSQMICHRMPPEPLPLDLPIPLPLPSPVPSPAPIFF